MMIQQVLGRKLQEIPSFAFKKERIVVLIFAFKKERIVVVLTTKMRLRLSSVKEEGTDLLFFQRNASSS